MPTKDQEDRREYYRIHDYIALDFRPLNDAEAHSHALLHDDSSLFNTLNELYTLELEAQHLLRQIDDTDRTLHSFLRVLNKRVDLLGSAMAQRLYEQFGKPQPVTLSEAGLGFEHSTPLAMGSLLALRLLMPEQALCLLLRASVNHCQPIAEGRYQIGTKFEQLADTQRQLLARYILQKQAQERRKLRQQSPAKEP
jgi:hypothetical protein